MMGVDALEELVGWPNNGNTFLASGPDGMRLAVAPADVGGEIGMMAAFDWAYARYGAACLSSRRWMRRFSRAPASPSDSSNRYSARFSSAPAGVSATSPPSDSASPAASSLRRRLVLRHQLRMDSRPPCWRW